MAGCLGSLTNRGGPALTRWYCCWYCWHCCRTRGDLRLACCRHCRLQVQQRALLVPEELEKVLVTQHAFSPRAAAGLAGFVQPLLAYDPARRPSAQQAAAHEWLKGPAAGESEESADEDSSTGAG